MVSQTNCYQISNSPIRMIFYKTNFSKLLFRNIARNQPQLKIFIMKKNLTYLLAFLFLVSCKDTKNYASYSPPLDDGKIEVVFLQVNDVYEISPLENGQAGGMARVANFKKDLLKKNANTFLFHAGDFLNPSLLGTMKVDGQRLKGRHMIEVMNAMNFDLVAFGNHEFDIKESELQERLNESTFQWSSTNCRQVVCEDQYYPFYKERNGNKEFIPDTHIIETKDSDGTPIKIGFFSVTLNSNPKDFVQYRDVFTEAKRAYEYLATRTDIVIGLTHVSKETDIELAKILPDVPLLMGGHEHFNMLIEEGNTIITKADANAKTVYVHTLQYDHNLKSLNLKSELVPITPATGTDEEVRKIVTKWESVLNEKITEVVANPKEVIYVAKEPLDGIDDHIRSGPTNLGVIIAKSITASYNNNVDGVFYNGGSVRIDDMLAGDVTAVDVFRILPFGGGTVKVKMTGELLKKTLDFGLESKGKGSYLQLDNINFNDTNNTWNIGGHQLDVSKNYIIATTGFLLKGYDIPFLKEDNPGILEITKASTPDQEDLRNAVINYMKGL